MLRLGLSVAAVVAVADQLTKWWVLALFADPAITAPIAVTPFFNLVLVWNRGVSFGMFGGEGAPPPWVLVAIALAIAAVLVVWMRRADHAGLAAALGLIVGGAVGNVVDRIVHDAVVDFLDFHYAGFRWPAFNVADAAITVGVAYLLLDALLPRRRPHKINEDETSR